MRLARTCTCVGTVGRERHMTAGTGRPHQLVWNDETQSGTPLGRERLSRLPAYFFHVHNVELSIDTQGRGAARRRSGREATSYAAAFFKDIGGRFRPGQEWSLEVMNEAKKPIFFVVR